MSRINTKYMGLDLRSPVIVSACSLSEEIENIRIMEAAGAGAVVLFSLFEEQIHLESEKFTFIEEDATGAPPSERSAYFPNLESYHINTEEYLEHIREAKSAVEIPIIASLSGATPEGWIQYARQIEKAGADAIEINVFFIPADPGTDGQEVENRYLNIIRALRKNVRIPVSVKLNPYFSAMAHMAEQFRAAGAQGLVLFNRFFQPDFDIENLEVVSTIQYSSTNEIRLPLLWIGALYDRIEVSLAATSGVQTAQEVIKYILAGSDAVMVASTLYQNGLGYINTLNDDLKAWMNKHDFETLDQMRGLMSQSKIADPAAYERANYIKIIGIDRNAQS